MKYDCVLVFHKMSNLASYFAANEHKLVGHLNIDDRNYEACYDNIANRYAEHERLVRLILLVRYERDQNTGKFKTMCRIRCPINPFPVKGEFEAPSMNAVKYSLINLGWVETEAIAGFMLE